MNHVLRVTAQVMVMAIIISVILLFVGIGVLIVIHVCVVGRAFRRGFGNGSMEDRGSFGSTSMSQDDIEKLPSFNYRDKKKGSSPVDCAVCLENLKVGDKCRLLPQCKHSFHAQCVDVWLLRTPICPICRTNADRANSGLNFDEEIGHLTEAAVESTESQAAENGHMMNASIDVRVIPTSIESTHWNDGTPNESQAAEDGHDHQDQTVIELRERQEDDHDHHNEASTEVRRSTHESEISKLH